MTSEPRSHEPDDLVILDDFGDQFTADLVAAKLRAFGIHAEAQGATAHGGVRLPAGNVVWVFTADLDDARQIVADD